MATLREIKRRIVGVKSTQKITRAMKVVATTRLKKYERMIAEGADYLEPLERAFFQLALSKEKLDHPLMTPNGAKEKIGVIVISSDRGLCGSFNSQLFKQAEQFIDEKFSEKDTAFFLVGAKAHQYFKNEGKEILHFANRLSDDEKHEAVVEIIQKAVDFYNGGEISELHLIFNGYQSRSDFGFRNLTLLPFDYKKFLPGGLEKDGSYFLIEPGIPECLEVLIPLFLNSIFSDAIVQSQTAEELSRMLAMDYATENANELIEDLTLIYNRTRQEVITKEISEIVGGAEALK